MVADRADLHCLCQDCDGSPKESPEDRPPSRANGPSLLTLLLSKSSFKTASHFLVPNLG